MYRSQGQGQAASFKISRASSGRMSCRAKARVAGPLRCATSSFASIPMPACEHARPVSTMSMSRVANWGPVDGRCSLSQDNYRAISMYGGRAGLRRLARRRALSGALRFPAPLQYWLSGMKTVSPSSEGLTSIWHDRRLLGWRGRAVASSISSSRPSIGSSRSRSLSETKT